MLPAHPEPSSTRASSACCFSATLGLALLAAITGCKTGPNATTLTPADATGGSSATFAPPELTAAEIAADPTASTAARHEEPLALDHWWERFGDDSLNALIARADASNATLAQALSNVRVAQARLGVTESQLWPTVSSGAAYQRVQQNFSELNIPGLDTDPINQFSYGLSMPAWEIDIWGRIARLVESSTAQLNASVDDLRSALTSVRAQTATAYIQVRTLQARLDALDANLANLAQTLSLSTLKFQSGTVTQLDVNQAQTNLDMASAQIPALRTSIADAIGQLADLCGCSTTEVSSLLGKQRAIPIGPDAVAVGVPASLLERRADLRSAQQRYNSAVAQIGANEALNYPALALSGSFSISATEVSGLGDINNRAYSFGPSLSLPLFTGWAISSQILMAKANAEYAFNGWRKTLIHAVAEVDTTIASLALARDTDARFRKAVASASDTYRLAQQQYEAGTTTLENLLSIQNQLLSAQDSEAQSRGLVASNIVQLYRSLGGGWDDLVPAPASNATNSAKDAINEANGAVDRSPAHASAQSPLAKSAAASATTTNNN